MEEEGSWPRLGLLLLSGVAVLWLVLCLLAFLSYVSSAFSLVRFPMIAGSWGVYSPTPRGYNGNVTSWWVRIVSVRGPGLGPAEGLWFAGFPRCGAPRA